MQHLKIFAATLLIALIASSVTRAEVAEVAGFQEKCVEAEGVEPQQQPHWCWAACIQATLSFYGIERSQKEIVSQTFGAPIDASMSDPSITYRALNNLNIGNDGSVEAVKSKYFKGSPPGIFITSELEHNHPVILGYMNPDGLTGHVVVVYKASYTSTPMGSIVDRVWYFDPWPGEGIKSASRLELAPRTVCVFAVRGYHKVSPGEKSTNESTDSAKPAPNDDQQDGDAKPTHKPKQNDSKAAEDITCHSEDDKIKWHPTPEEHTVDFSIPYENTGERAIKCTITVMTGTVPRDADHGDYSEWTATERKSFTVTIAPGKTKTIHGTLNWDRSDPNTMPRIRFGDPTDDDNKSLIKCAYVEDDDSGNQ